MDLNHDKIQRLADTIRMLSAEAVQEANSGHPGMPMGTAEIGAVLWSMFLRFHPEVPGWINRDRFVLSAGHGSMLLYSLLHLFGCGLPLSELRKFRQWRSKTPGHPEFGLTNGVEATTGPLGQGFSNAVGMALSSRMLAERYSKKVFNYRVYVVAGDGDLMEGVSSEAASLAGHLGLGNLVCIYDNNHITIGGRTDISFTESVPKRFEAYRWHVQWCNGHDIEALFGCIDRAIKVTDRPSIICARTTIGKGSPHKADTSEVHGAPLGKEELELVRKQLNFPADQPYCVPLEVAEFCASCLQEKKADFSRWAKRYDEWREKQPESAEQLICQIERKLPPELKTDLVNEFQADGQEATRALSGKALQVIARHLPGFIGGSADLEPSTLTLLKDAEDVQAEKFLGRNLRFGVREHAMGAIANGLAYTKLWLPYTATFLVFADYMRPPVRVAAMARLQTFFIFTHDSFYVGEDGPTHQPVEQIMSLRAIPNLYVFRPADGKETALCYWAALQRGEGPSALLFTRQKLPSLERDKQCSPDDVLMGAYVVTGKEVQDLVIIATGSEVHMAMAAAKMLKSSQIRARVVSMPCRELFLRQKPETRERIIPRRARKVSLEAGITMGWEGIVGSDGLMIGWNEFGLSAPANVLAENFGFTPQDVASKIKSWLNL